MWLGLIIVLVGLILTLDMYLRIYGWNFEKYIETITIPFLVSVTFVGVSLMAQACFE